MQDFVNDIEARSPESIPVTWSPDVEDTKNFVTIGLIDRDSIHMDEYDGQVCMTGLMTVTWDMKDAVQGLIYRDDVEVAIHCEGTLETAGDRESRVLSIDRIVSIAHTNLGGPAKGRILPKLQEDPEPCPDTSASHTEKLQS